MFFDSKDKTTDIKLEDVTPLHPNEYPAKHLKEKLDARHDALEDHKEDQSSHDGIGST